jgi:hypothetical protein
VPAEEGRDPASASGRTRRPAVFEVADALTAPQIRLVERAEHEPLAGRIYGLALRTGRVLALRTGRVAWRARLPRPVLGSSTSGLAAGEGVLVVPATGCSRRSDDTQGPPAKLVAGGLACAGGGTAYFFFGGMSTRLIAWITPFDAATSACTTLAPATRTLRPLLRT